MQRNVLLAIIAAIIVVAGAGAAVVLLGKGGDSGTLTITEGDTVINGGSYDRIIIESSVGNGNAVYRTST